MPDGVSQQTLELAADTLTGDITGFLVDHLRQSECAYRYMPEDQQREIISKAKRAAENLVKEAVAVIAADGRDTIPVRIKKVENDGAKIKCTIEADPEDQRRHPLFDAAGHAAHLTVADVEKYEGGAEPKPDPDQPGLPDPESAAA